MKLRGVAALAAIGLAMPAPAAIITYQGGAGLAGFNFAAGNPGIGIDFDTLADGNIAGATINGVTFSSPDGNTLDVVDGNSTFTPGGFGGTPNPETNKLFPTSGAKVLSPGGANLAPGPDIRQRDSLQLDFAAPLSAFGLDILFQSYDAASLTGYQLFLYDSSYQLVASGSVVSGSGGGGDPGDAIFLGFLSTDPSTNFSRLVITESDDNDQFPDANIGFDSFRFASAVPEPASWAMMIGGFGLIGGMLRRRGPVRALA